MNFEQGRIALLRALAQHWFRNEDDTEIGYKAAREWYLGELGEPPGLVEAYALGKKLLTWKPPDSNDSQPIALEDERCARCDVRKFDWIHIGGRNERGWYCVSCWYERGYT